MSEPNASVMPEGGAPASDALVQRVEALRSAGAPRLDPVRFRYIETVLRRLADAQSGVREQLMAALGRVLTECEERVRERRPLVAPTAEAVSASVPAGADPQISPIPAPEPLVALNRYIVAAANGQAESGDYDLASPVWESSDGLRNARRFRESWQRHSMEDALGLAVERAPEAAGPLNSHRLVLRTMTLMQELSPAYLQHFVEHAETLLWIDRATARFRQAPSAPKAKPQRAAKRPKS